MITSLRPIERNAGSDDKVDYEVILYEEQTSDFLHIDVKSICPRNIEDIFLNLELLVPGSLIQPEVHKETT